VSSAATAADEGVVGSLQDLAWLTHYLPPPMGRKHAMVTRLLKVRRPVHAVRSHDHDDPMNQSQQQGKDASGAQRWVVWGWSPHARTWFTSCELTSGLSLVWLLTALVAGWYVVRRTVLALHMQSSSASPLKAPAQDHGGRHPSATSKAWALPRPSAGRPGPRPPSTSTTKEAASRQKHNNSSTSTAAHPPAAAVSRSPLGVIPTHREMWEVKQRRFSLAQATLPDVPRTTPSVPPAEQAPSHTTPQDARNVDAESIMQAKVRNVLSSMGFAEGVANLAAKAASGVGGTHTLQARVDLAMEWLDGQSKIAAASSLRPQAAVFECHTAERGNEWSCGEPFSDC